MHAKLATGVLRGTRRKWQCADGRSMMEEKPLGVTWHQDTYGVFTCVWGRGQGYADMRQCARLPVCVGLWVLRGGCLCVSVGAGGI